MALMKRMSAVKAMVIIDDQFNRFTHKSMKWGKETNDVIYQTPFYVRCLKRDGAWTEWMPLYDAVTEGPCILLNHARSAARSLFVEKKWEISNGQVLFRKGGKAEKVIGDSICHPDKCNNNQQHSLSSVLN